MQFAVFISLALMCKLFIPGKSVEPIFAQPFTSCTFTSVVPVLIQLAVHFWMISCTLKQN